jgi:hypothetical protein
VEYVQELDRRRQRKKRKWMRSNIQNPAGVYMDSAGVL